MGRLQGPSARLSRQVAGMVFHGGILEVKRATLYHTATANDVLLYQSVAQDGL